VAAAAAVLPFVAYLRRPDVVSVVAGLVMMGAGVVVALPCNRCTRWRLYPRDRQPHPGGPTQEVPVARPARTLHRARRHGHGPLRALTGSVVVLAAVTAPAAPASAVETVHNGDITYSRGTPAVEDFTLWTARSDGSNPRQLTDTPAYFNDWAPDGRRVAYDFPDADGEQIATMRLDGSHPRQLTSGPGIQEVPRYAPDGRHVAFDASATFPDQDPSFHANIWVMRTDGSHAHALTRDTFDVEPVYSPDSRRIVFGRITGVRPNGVQDEALYVMRVDGTHVRQVLPPTAGLEHPDWSPDGR